MTTVAILPSRDEPATIGTVTTAIDTALDDPHAVIIHADASPTPETATNFAATRTRARKLALTGLPLGKGIQILTAAQTSAARTAEVVLIADTDTRNPDPHLYRGLIDQVRAGAALSIADYPRWWDEANLTNHLARPLIAATTGNDIPQPLAGDLATTPQTLTATSELADQLPTALRSGVHGYGIDATLLLTAMTTGHLTTVETGHPKHHAASFPHLPAIYHDVTPILLHLTTSHTRPTTTTNHALNYRAHPRTVPAARLADRLDVLDALLAEHAYEDTPWAQALAHAAHSVASGTIAAGDAANRLWPHYLHRVRGWLTQPHPDQAASILAAAHARLHTAITLQGASPR